MADTRLDILVVPTYNAKTLGIADASTYNGIPSASSIEITVPALGQVVLPFNYNSFNVFNSTSLGLSDVGQPLIPLPDGVYLLKYSIAPAYLYSVEKSIIRVDQLQEKFDSAFMKLDMMECDMAIKTQQKVTLSSINFFIQGAIAAANNCAIAEANKLYAQANRMLDNFNKNGCQCSGNNYTVNFH
jgi:hypothetical protein